MSAAPPAINPVELRGRIERGEKVVLLDVREHDEVQICRIEGALHIPMNDVPGRLGELDPGASTVVYCHHGIRSNMVASFLLARGFKDVSNLTGGIDLWAATVDGDLARY